MEFEKLGVSKELSEILVEEYILEPTEIQKEAIPSVLAGKNIIARSQTGTGKTLAFLLPIIDNLDEDKALQCLILTPTRELASQILNVIKNLTQNSDLVSSQLIGGHDLDKQENQANKSHIIVGTPGRILDLIGKGKLYLKDMSFMVVDEADQMMVFDFLEDISLLYSKLPDRIQTMLFSATMPTAIVKLSKEIVKNPIQINISDREEITENISQFFISTTEGLKYQALIKIIEQLNPFLGIIFCSSKNSADELYYKLSKDGISCDITHGEFSQKKRENTLKNFRNMKFIFLVTTDLSARGFDIDGVTHVINYDLPSHSTYYVHRIGRTGRMKDNGIALSLYTSKEEAKFSKIKGKLKEKPSIINYTNKNEENSFIKRLKQIKEEITF